MCVCGVCCVCTHVSANLRSNEVAAEEKGVSKSPEKPRHGHERGGALVLGECACVYVCVCVCVCVWLEHNHVRTCIVGLSVLACECA